MERYDEPTKYQGVRRRHGSRCRRTEDHGARCNCEPSYYGQITLPGGAKRKTRAFKNVTEACNARDDLRVAVSQGRVVVAGRGAITLTAAREQFIAKARSGQSLNKRGQVYKRRSVDDIEECLRRHVEPKPNGSRTMGDAALTKVRRADVQAIVDGLELSGNRVRSVVNAVHSLYKWAELHELVPEGYDPAARVRLPAKNTKQVGRDISAPVFARMLTVLPTADALVYALAGYALARREQIRWLHWRDFDFEAGTVALAEEEEARKTDAARRTLPMVPPLAVVAKRAYLEAGRPDGKRLVFEPRHTNNRTGLMNAQGLTNRTRKAWGKDRLTLREARGCGSTWLAAAGVHPKLHSYFMGHKTVDGSQLGGGSALTQNVYTQARWEDIVGAAQAFAKYLATAQRKVAL